MGEKRNAYMIWVGKPEGKRLLGRRKRRCEGNIKVDLRERECGGMDRIDWAEDRDKWRAIVNMRMKLRVP
jgi:hypothetical protein